MNIHFFFSGKLSREESASAFLASLLEQRVDFRIFFFDLLSLPKPEGNLSVDTEVNDVDVRIDYSIGMNNCVVLIENKIRSGAIQQNQLVRYYEKELSRKKSCIIKTVFITPHKSSGDAEVKRLDAVVRQGDSIQKISWCDDLVEYKSIISDDDFDKDLICGAFDSILKVIKLSENEKYPLAGGRHLVHEIAQRVMTKLTPTSPRLMLWRAKDCFDIYTVGTDIGIDLLFKFDVERKEPFSPIGLDDEKHLRITITSVFGLSSKGKKNQNIRIEWERLVNSNEFKILPEGSHRLEGHRFAFNYPIVGKADLVVETAIRIGRMVVDFLRRNGLLENP